jgi:uncharacterized protein (DUF433 family)
MPQAIQNNSLDLYGGENPIYLPAYTMKDVSGYLDIPYSTVRYWVRGRNQRVQGSGEKIPPIIDPPDQETPTLSFVNLVELHVLDALRRKGVTLQNIRVSLEFIEDHVESTHPLASIDFQTNGIDLFVENANSLLNVSKQGQIAMKEIMNQYLSRIERDEEGVVKSLYPFIRSSRRTDQPRNIMMNPRVSFGRPVLAENGVRTDIIFERYHAGDSISELAADYRCDEDLIEDAIRCESKRAA